MFRSFPACCAPAASGHAAFGGMIREPTVLGLDAQIAHEPVEALLVAVVLLPAGEVSDVALPAQQPSPAFRGLHHGIISRSGDRIIEC